MDKVLALMEDIGRYLTLLKVTDFVDIAIIIFLVYKLLSLVKSTRAENILKGVAIFLLALGLSTALDLRAVKYILSHVVDWGILALIILFQPEIRSFLERVGSSRMSKVFVQPPEAAHDIDSAISPRPSRCAVFDADCRLLRPDGSPDDSLSFAHLSLEDILSARR